MLNLKSCLRDIANKIQSLNNVGLNCSANSNSQFTVSANTITPVPCNIWRVIGDGFTFKNNGIVVPYSGTMILVGSIYAIPSDNSTYVGCYLHCNDNELASSYQFNPAGAVSASYIIKVDQGDVITLSARASKSLTIRGNSSLTYLSMAYIR